MKEQEVLKLIALCSANYSNWPADGKEAATAMLWQTMLCDISYDIALAAVKTHMSRSVYPPTIADIKGAAEFIANPFQLDWSEAWEKIGTSIRKFGLYRADEALASLPDEVAEVARRFGFRELCLNENVDTLRAQFRMAWETQSKRRREERLLPADVLKLQSQTVGRLMG